MCPVESLLQKSSIVNVLRSRSSDFYGCPYLHGRKGEMGPLAFFLEVVRAWNLNKPTWPTIKLEEACRYLVIDDGDVPFFSGTTLH